MSRRRSSAVALLALAGFLALAAPASAKFGSIRLVSKGAAQQADEAVTPAISADGRYVAFRATLGARLGILREDLDSGAIEWVVGADPTAGSLEAQSAAPAISADGRYVSFATPARLDPDDDLQNNRWDVYVADMSASPPTYELASALDGCDPGREVAHTACGLTYTGSGTGGSEASSRVALSADGRRVAFFTNAESNLTSEAGGSTEGVPTPALQVAVRDLDSDETVLASTERDPESGEMTERPVPGGALISEVGLPNLRGAALSGDGTTAAWYGGHLAAQVSMPAAEAERIEATGLQYGEPLWRRIAAGPQAAIRRMVAGDGAADPYPDLTEKDTTNLNFAQGWLGPQMVNGVPQLSFDGRTAALIGNPAEATNAFLVDMHDGLTRAQAVRPLTREVVVEPTRPWEGVNLLENVPLNGHIYDIGISADGRRVAFATARQRFPLAPPNLINEPPATLGLVELFLADLETESIERITHGNGGESEPSLRDGQSAISANSGARAPSLGGRRIAFSSTASNLVEADGTEARDIFVVEDESEPALPAQVSIEPAPAPAPRQAPWRLTVTAFSARDGSVRLVAVTPAAGSVRVRVEARPGGARKARKVAARKRRARRGGRVALKLRLPRRYRRLAHRREGVYGTARVTFRRKGSKPLRGTVQVRFVVHRRQRGER